MASITIRKLDAALKECLRVRAVCQAEILCGIAVLPEGLRRRDLETAARAMFTEDFADRVLPFDTVVAVAYAETFQVRRGAGHPMATVDLMIASIARSHDSSVVTRSVADFENCGVAIANPWVTSL